MKNVKQLTRLKQLDDPVFTTLMLVAVFAIFNRVLLRPYQLSIESYHSSFLTIETIKDVFDPSIRSLLIVGILALLVFNFQKALGRWSDWKFGGQVQTVVCLSAGVLTWVYSTYDISDYLGQRHLLDRLLLVAAFFGVVWRPVFVFPFLFMMWPMLGQFNVPVGGFSWAIPFLPSRILLLFASAVLIRFHLRKWPSKSFVVVLLCLVAGHYFSSGIGKLKIGWLLNEQTYLMLPNTYANGWLGFVEVPTLEWLTQLLSIFNWPIKLITIFGEVGCLLLFWRKWTLQIFLLLWPVFHLGVFFMSGIFFWPWIAIDLTLLVLVTRCNLMDGYQFNFNNVVLTVMLIGTSPYWAKGVNLSWIESPLTYTYQVVAIGEEGKRFVVPPFEMGPYDYQFSLGGFRYLSDQPNLPVTWGATGLSMYEGIKDVSSVEEALRFEQEYGTVFYDLGASRQFEEFLKIRFNRPNEGKGQSLFPQLFCAPKYIWTFRTGDALLPDKIVSRVEIEQVFTGYIEGSFEVIRRKTVCSVDLAPLLKAGR